MKYTLTLILFFVIAGSSVCFSQGKGFTAPPGELLQNNKEEVFIHYNAAFLLAGETLYYKFYCLDEETGKLKNLSKIGYLELTGEDGKQVFLHKVALDNGSGYGDFLIPSTVPSGSYKLLGYTRWMQNAGKEHFFRGDLVIVNPYMEDQSRIEKVGEDAQDGTAGVTVESPSEEEVESSNSAYSFSTNGNSFKKREKIELSIDKLNNSSAPGNLSISVKKIEVFRSPQVLNSTNYKSIYKAGNWDSGTRVTLPDLRGQVISGKLVGENETVEAGGRSVVFSIPGKPFFVRIAKTAADGTFLFNLETRDFGSQAYLQVLGENKEKFQIILDEVPQVARENLEYQKFTVTPSMVELIRQRSIYNQVENSYTVVKQDSVLPKSNFVPFYGSSPEYYDLDAYTRFPTLQETFLEIIQLARIRKNRDGTSQLELASGAGAPGSKPLLVVDGLIVQDHEDFVYYDAGKVKSIGIERGEYFLGPEVFNGLIVVETIIGNFFTSINRPYIKTEDLHNLQLKKQYFQPQYNSQKDRESRVPDYRLQLLWQPVVEVEGSSSKIEFYTSDVPGNYEINLQGFTDEGEPVSLKKIISVE